MRGFKILIRAVMLSSSIWHAPASFAQTPFKSQELVEQRRISASLDALCGSIDNQTRSRDNPEEYSFAYEKQFYLAAKIDFKIDTQDSAIRKLQNLWTNYPASFICTSFNFSVPNGNVLKYAIETRSNSILENAIASWHLELNQIDPSDCRTLLDFVDWKLAQDNGAPVAEHLRFYSDRLRKAGAKYAKEIDVLARRVQEARWNRSAALRVASGVNLGFGAWKCY